MDTNEALRSMIAEARELVGTRGDRERGFLLDVMHSFKRLLLAMDHGFCDELEDEVFNLYDRQSSDELEEFLDCSFMLVTQLSQGGFLPDQKLIDELVAFCNEHPIVVKE